MDTPEPPWMLIALAPAAFGALLAFLGWAGTTERLSRNWVLGIRTPTTLRSTDAWRAAHRAAGGWWIAGGLATIACALIGGALGTPMLLPASLLLALAALLVGSFVGMRAARREAGR